jgi:hypothetical protein
MSTLAKARSTGPDYSYVRFEPFEAQWVRLPDATRRDIGKWTFKPAGQAQVIGGGRMWIPRVGDVQQNVKELTVTAYTGKPRSLRFVFRVHASVEKGEGPAKTVTVLGREEIEVQLLQRPGEKSFRVVLDPLTFRKHQAMLDSNWVAEEEQAAKEEEKKRPRDGKEDKDAATEPPAPEPEAEQGPGSEVTLVRYFKADDREITIGFRRKWSAGGNRVVNGTLHIRLNSTLNSSLYYDAVTKSGKPGKVLAASFTKGHRIW